MKSVSCLELLPDAIILFILQYTVDIMVLNLKFLINKYTLFPGSAYHFDKCEAKGGNCTTVDNCATDFTNGEFNIYKDGLCTPTTEIRVCCIPNDLVCDQKNGQCTDNADSCLEYNLFFSWFPCNATHNCCKHRKVYGGTHGSSGHASSHGGDHFSGSGHDSSHHDILGSHLRDYHIPNFLKNNFK